MFKALGLDGASIIILDILDAAALEALRQKGRENWLLCPKCKQPVLVKAGAVKRRHFAHKDLSNCPLTDEPTELLVARETLYTWLKQKFKEHATIEHAIDGVDLPRGFDCWVTCGGKSFAYWIVVRAIKHCDERELIAEAARSANALLHVVFLNSMLQRNGTLRDLLSLTTTERDFIRKSEYDKVYSGYNHRREGSLHYLNSEPGTLTTFRAAGCIESPQRYRGHEVTTSLSELKVSPDTGEFVHPSEFERRAAQRKAAAEQAEAARKRKQEEELRIVRERGEREKRWAEEAARRARDAALEAEEEEDEKNDEEPDASKNETRRTPKRSPLDWLSEDTSKYSAPKESREAACESCGVITPEAEWTVYTPAKGTCKCRSCMDPRAPRR